MLLSTLLKESTRSPSSVRCRGGENTLTNKLRFKFPRVTPVIPVSPFYPCYPSYSLFPIVTPLTPCFPSYPLLPFVTPVTPCNPCYPLLPFVTLCYPLLPLLPIVTTCFPCYPMLPFVTLVTPCYLCYPLLPLDTLCYPLLPLVILCSPLLPLLPLVTFCSPLFPLLPVVTLCYPLLPLLHLVTPVTRKTGVNRLNLAGLGDIRSAKTNTPAIMSYIRQRLLDIEEQTWISEIHNDERKDPHQKNKLRTFRKFKLTHDYENYLTNVRNINHRVAITN